MAKNSYEGENPFATANKMSSAKPGKQGKKFHFRRAPKETEAFNWYLYLMPTDICPKPSSTQV